MDEEEGLKKDGGKNRRGGGQSGFEPEMKDVLSSCKFFFFPLARSAHTWNRARLQSIHEFF